MRVLVDIEEVELSGSYSDDIPSLEGTCTECGKTVECYGRTDRSVRRIFWLLRDECSHGKTTYYYTEYDGEYE